MIQTNRDGLLLHVAVDGREVAAQLPGGLLQRRFGADGGDDRSWLKAYRQHAARINRVAIFKGRQLRALQITLLDEDFAPA